MAVDSGLISSKVHEESFSETESITSTFVAKESFKEILIGSRSEILKPNDFLDQYFNLRGPIVPNEQWDENINVQSQIIELSKDFVTCSCLVDKDKRIFENRSFPSNLFAHMHNLHLKSFVILNIKSKAGSIRIDVWDGEKMVDKKLFDENSFWEDVDGHDFNSSLEGPLRIDD